LRETRIAAELGVSRAPLREALSKLEEEGLIVKVPFRGAFVAEVGPKVIDEIATLRMCLEPFAIQRALPWLQGAGRAPFNALLKELHRAAIAGDAMGCIDTHLAIHRMFYEAADHKLLLDAWNSWEWQLRLFLAVDLRSFANLTDIAKRHSDLYNIITSGDLPAIEQELRDHIHGAADAMPVPEPKKSAKRPHKG